MKTVNEMYYPGRSVEEILTFVIIVFPAAIAHLITGGGCRLEEFTDDILVTFWPVLFPIILPAMVLTGLAGLLRTRTSIAILGLTVISTGFLIAGNLTGWFGHFSGTPKMWHKAHYVKLFGEDAVIVHLHIQNEGKGTLRLRLDPALSPEEPSSVLSAKQYDGTQKVWVEYPTDKLLSSRSKSLFPVEISPGGTLLVEMIFYPSDRREKSSAQQRNITGKYSISIVDPARMRLHHHEIDIPEFDVSSGAGSLTFFSFSSSVS